MWILLLGIQAASAGYGDAVDGAPSVEERALHVWTNAMRMAPGAFAESYTCKFDNFKPDEKVGKAPLGMDLRLYDAAHLHSSNMAKNNFFEHTDPNTRKGPESRVSDAGYPWVAVGENIAGGMSTAKEAMLGWMCSSGHRSNIMTAEFFELGTGMASGGSFGFYWTQNFGSRTQQRDVPAVASGVHESRGSSTLLLVNVDGGEAPDAVVAAVDGEAAPMVLGSGTEARGTWRVSVDAGSGCHLYWFEADFGGTIERFPEEGAYAFGSCGAGDLDDDGAMWASAETTADMLGGTTLFDIASGGDTDGGGGPDGKGCGGGDVTAGAGALVGSWLAVGLLGIMRRRRG